MSAARDRRKANERAAFWAVRRPVPPCMRCGRPGPHYVPPSVGEAGFFVCEPAPVREDGPSIPPEAVLHMVARLTTPPAAPDGLGASIDPALHAEACQALGLEPGSDLSWADYFNGRAQHDQQV